MEHHVGKTPLTPIQGSVLDVCLRLADAEGRIYRTINEISHHLNGMPRRTVVRALAELKLLGLFGEEKWLEVGDRPPFWKKGRLTYRMLVRTLDFDAIRALREVRYGARPKRVRSALVKLRPVVVPEASAPLQDREEGGGGSSQSGLGGSSQSGAQVSPDLPLPLLNLTVSPLVSLPRRQRARRPKRTSWRWRTVLDRSKKRQMDPAAELTDVARLAPEALPEPAQAIETGQSPDERVLNGFESPEKPQDGPIVTATLPELTDVARLAPEALPEPAQAIAVRGAAVRLVHERARLFPESKTCPRRDYAFVLERLSRGTSESELRAVLLGVAQDRDENGDFRSPKLQHFQYFFRYPDKTSRLESAGNKRIDASVPVRASEKARRICAPLISDELADILDNFQSALSVAEANHPGLASCSRYTQREREAS